MTCNTTCRDYRPRNLQKGDTGDSAYDIWRANQAAGADTSLDAFLKAITASDGASAYQLWLASGNKGTEAQFLASLKGAKGDKGDKGDTGPQGVPGSAAAKGDKGDKGDKGPAGEKGDTGPQGPKGDKGDTGPQGPKGESGGSSTQIPDGVLTGYTAVLDSSVLNLPDSGYNIITVFCDLNIYPKPTIVFPDLKELPNYFELIIAVRRPETRDDATNVTIDIRDFNVSDYSASSSLEGRGAKQDGSKITITGYASAYEIRFKATTKDTVAFQYRD